MRVSALLLSLLLYSVPVLAVTIERPLENPAQEQVARDSFTQLKCVVCAGQSLADSDALFRVPDPMPRVERSRQVDHGEVGGRTLLDVEEADLDGAPSEARDGATAVEELVAKQSVGIVGGDVAKGPLEDLRAILVLGVDGFGDDVAGDAGHAGLVAPVEVQPVVENARGATLDDG